MSLSLEMFILLNISNYDRLCSPLPISLRYINSIDELTLIQEQISQLERKDIKTLPIKQ